MLKFDMGSPIRSKPTNLHALESGRQQSSKTPSSYLHCPLGTAAIAMSIEDHGKLSIEDQDTLIRVVVPGQRLYSQVNQMRNVSSKLLDMAVHVKV